MNRIFDARNKSIPFYYFLKPYLSKALKQFCQSTTYRQRKPNSLKQISPVLSVSNRSEKKNENNPGKWGTY